MKLKGFINISTSVAHVQKHLCLIAASMLYNSVSMQKRMCERTTLYISINTNVIMLSLQPNAIVLHILCLPNCFLLWHYETTDPL